MPDSILERWDITAEELTEVVDQNPSLRGMILGYLAELKLEKLWLSGNQIAALTLHGLFSHVPQTRQVRSWRSRSIPLTNSSARRKLRLSLKRYGRGLWGQVEPSG